MPVAKSEGCSCARAYRGQALPPALSGVTPQHLRGFPAQFGAQKLHIKYETSRAKIGTGMCCQKKCGIWDKHLAVLARSRCSLIPCCYPKRKLTPEDRTARLTNNQADKLLLLNCPLHHTSVLLSSGDICDCLLQRTECSSDHSLQKAGVAKPARYFCLVAVMPFVGGIAAYSGLMHQPKAQDADLAQMCPSRHPAACCSAAGTFSYGLPHATA